MKTFTIRLEVIKISNPEPELVQKKLVDSKNEVTQKTLLDMKAAGPKEVSKNEKKEDENRGLRKCSEVKKWLKNKSDSTTENYLYALALFTEFTGEDPGSLLEKGEPSSNPNEKREKKCIELEIMKFHDWLRWEKPVERPIECGQRIDYTGEKGLSEKTVKNYVSAVKSFFESNGCSLKSFRI